MKTQAVVRTAVRVGAVAGALCVVWVLLLYFTQQNPFGPKRLMSMFVPPVAVLMAEWQLRKRHLEAANFGRLLLTGMLSGLIVAALSALGVYALARMAGPQLLERNRREMEQMVRAERPNFLKEKNGRAQYERTLRSIATTPQDVANDDFSKKLLLGLLLSVPGAVFFRR